MSHHDQNWGVGRTSELAGHRPSGEGTAGVPGENSCFQTALIPATIVSIHTTLKTISLSLISFSSRCKSSTISDLQNLVFN